MRYNGNHGPVLLPQPPPEDHSSIIIGLALRIGRLEGAVFHRKPEPPLLWVHYVVGAALCGLAAGGKVSWQDALPSVLGMLAR